MKKNLLVVLLAALLLVSAVACGDQGTEKETDSGTDTNVETTVNSGEGTNPEGTNEVTNPVEDNTSASVGDNVSEENPTFTEVNKTLYVWYAAATIRSSTVLSDDNAIAWPTEGTTLVANAESTNWYRITYEDKTAYIAKTVVGDYALIQGMTPVDNEEIEISADVNVRTFPSAEGGDKTIRGALKKGTKVTRVAKGENWSCILYTVVSETETTADGKPVEEIKQYFIINDCIKGTETTDTSAE